MAVQHRIRRWLPFCRSLALSALILTGLACSRPREPTPRRVILITLDTFRADHMGVYGREPSLTPRIDAFSRLGTIYDNAYSPIPITLPAHASLFYSLPPHALGLYNNGQLFDPDPALISLAEIFRRRGFQTAAFISLGVLGARFQPARGFQDYWDIPHPRRWYRTAGEVNEAVFPWLERHLDLPFFLWIHYSDPHDPYAPPNLPSDLRIHHNGEILTEVCVRKRETLEINLKIQNGANLLRFECLQPFPVARRESRISLNDIVFQNPEGLEISFPRGTLLQRGKHRILAFRESGEVLIRNPGPERGLTVTAQGNINLFPSEQQVGYRQEIRYLDGEFGRLQDKLDALGLLDQSLIVLAGDHGEGLGEYLGSNQEVHFGHIHYLKSLYVRVPLIVVDPSSAAVKPRRVTDLVSLLDIAPFLVKRLGRPRPRFFEGKLLPRRSGDRDRLLFEETFTPEAVQDRFGVRRDPWHLILTPENREFQLYHMGKDRFERQNVYPLFQQEPEIRELARILIRRSQEVLDSKLEVKLDESSREMLRSLGYIR